MAAAEKDGFHMHQYEVIFGDAGFRLLFYGSGMTIDDEYQYHIHKYYEMHVMISGKGTLILKNGAAVTLEKGEALILSPAEEHQSIAYSGENPQGTTLNFMIRKTEADTPLYAEIIKRIEQQAQTLSVLSVGDTFLSDLQFLQKLSVPVRMREYCFAQTIASRLIYTLLDIVGCYSEQSAVGAAAAEDTRQLILLDNLINNYELTEREISERLGYSARHTQRLIRRCYGVCLKELRQKQMCQTAVWLLENRPDMRTEQIALQSGFSGVRTLRRVFARRGMMSPERYRKETDERKGNKDP